MASLPPGAILGGAVVAAQATPLQPASRDEWIMPFAAWQVTLDGQDLTEAMKPILKELTLTEKRGEEADSLDITLGDENGALALPPPTATLSVALGWSKGTGVAAGLVDKGSFRVDELSWNGPPDIVTLTARAADLTSELRKRRDENWVAQSLSAIVGKIAKRHGLTPKVHQLLANVQVGAMRQHAKSDIAFVSELGRRYDAVATIKAGTLILAPIGTGTTAGGAAIPGVTIDKTMCSSYSWSRKKRDEHDGVEAQWRDQHGATTKLVKVGGSSNARRLKRTYSSESDAKAAAEGAKRRDARTAAEFTLTLAYGDASMMPERSVTLSGFKSEIDAQKWQIAEVTHRVDGSGGFTTSLTLDLGASGGEAT